MQVVSRLFKRLIANSKLEQLFVPSQQQVFLTSKPLTMGCAAANQKGVINSG